jgi:hypothetical protein
LAPIAVATASDLDKFEQSDRLRFGIRLYCAHGNDSTRTT